MEWDHRIEIEEGRYGTMIEVQKLEAKDGCIYSPIDDLMHLYNCT